MGFITSNLYAVGSSELIPRGAMLERPILEERLILHRNLDRDLGSLDAAP